MIYAKYTIVLKTLLDDPETKALIDKAMSTYPLYEKRSEEKYIPSYIPTREQLNKKILDYYKYREIGFETVGRFLTELEVALNEIMPYYNQLYFTVDQDYNIIYNVDYKRESETTRTGKATTTGSETQENENTSNGTTTASSQGSDTSDSEATMNSDSKTVESQTPQGVLDIAAKNIDSIPYADKVGWNDSDSEQTTKTTGTTTSETSSTNNQTTTASVDINKNDETNTQGSEQYSETIKGNYGQVSAQALISRYRNLIINIEQRIMNDPRITELFLGIY